MATDIPKRTSTEVKNPQKSGSCCFLNPCLNVRHSQSRNKNQPNQSDERPDMKESMDMVKAGGDDEEIPGRRSIGRAIEESLAMKVKGIALAEVVAARSDHHSFTNTREGETSSVGRANLVGDTNHSDSKPSSPRNAHQQPSAELDEGTAKVLGEKLNFEKQTNAEMEAYILDRLSALQPSFRTLFDPNSAGPSQKEGGKSKWRKRIEEFVGKLTNSGPKKQHQFPLDNNNLSEVNLKSFLDMRWEEEEESKRISNSNPSSLKQRTTKFCCSCPHTNSNGKNLEELEFQIQLEKYSSTW